MTEHATTSGNGPHRLAPSADPRWVDAFVIELRLLEVPGPAIGDHLATVEEHLRETGEGVLVAFGDPRRYARDLVPSDPAGRAVDRATAVGSGLGLLAIVLLPLATAGWVRGRDVEVSVGGLVVGIVLALALLGLLLAGNAALRLLVERRWVAVVIAPLLVAVLAAPLVLLPQRLGGLPALAVGLAGLLAMAVAVAAMWRTPPDLVRGPGEDAQVGTEGRLFATLLLPGFAVLACLAAWLLAVVG